jgi:hypothetical protein
VEAGGASIAAHPGTMPKEFAFFRKRVELHCELAKSIRQLILINHEDCHWYHANAGRLACTSGGAGRFDLRTMVSGRDDSLWKLVSKYKLRLERYFAYFANSERSQISFEKIE